MMRFIRMLYNKIRFGEVEFITTEIVSGNVAEYEVMRKKDGKLVGYFAYGYYDPKLPFKE